MNRLDSFYIFLDIDGVLNDHKFDGESSSCLINPQCVARFNLFLDKCINPKIILISAWRYMILKGDMTLQGFNYLLRTHGIKDVPIIDHLREESSPPEKRCEIIKEYLENNPHIRKFIVFDDLKLNVKNHIRTDGSVGLTSQNIFDAIKILEIQDGVK